jgi:hypothetical protein
MTLPRFDDLTDVIRADFEDEVSSEGELCSTTLF